MVVRMKERAVSGVGQAALSTGRTVCWPTRTGSDSSSVDVSCRTGLVSAWAPVIGRVGDFRAVRVLKREITERDAELDAGKVI